MTVQEGALLGGRYRLQESVGRGGMADVFLAFDEERQAPVAIKVLHAEMAADADFVRRFRSEAEALERLDHPHIVRFYAFAQTAGIVFIVMDYVAGVTLRDHLAAQRKPFDLAEISGILHDLSGALYYAHLKGIIHHDLKPSNVILRPDGRAVLTDFGIAHALGSAASTTVTMGTPAYMSPEQIRGDAPDARSDIYSLGVLLYEMAAGRLPFTGTEAGLTEANTTDRLHEAHLWLPAADPRIVNPRLSAEVSAVLLRTLAKRPGERWPDMLSLRLAWDAAVGPLAGAERKTGKVPPVTAKRGTGKTPATSAERKTDKLPFVAAVAAAPPVPARHRQGALIWLLGAGLVLALGAVAFIVMTLTQGSAASSGVQPAPAPPVAQTAATSVPVDTAAPAGPTPTGGGVVVVTAAPALVDTATPAGTTPTGGGLVMATAAPGAPGSQASTEPAGAASAEVSGTGAAPTGQAGGPTLAPTRTVEPTRTPEPARPSGATPPIPASSPAAGTGVPTGGVLLISPPAGEIIRGSATFAWSDAPGFFLRAGEQYELIIWGQGQDPLRDGRSPTGATDQTTVSANLTGVESALGLTPGQTYSWGVRLRKASGPVRMLSDGRAFTYERAGAGGGGRGGGGGGGGTPDTGCTGPGCK